MGDILGGIIGGIGSLIGGASSASGEQQAAQQALTGYNYLQSNPLNESLQSNAVTAQGNQNAAIGQEAGTVGGINSLLTSPNQNNPAFQNYLNSTGYNFQLQQGSNAITGNAAAKGLLDSGATAKALTGYGQNLASTSFNNYLGQLSGVAGLQGQVAGQYGNQVAAGENASTAVGQAGSTGGGNAAQQTAAAAQSTGTSIANAANLFGGAAANGFSTAGSNFFGAPTPVNNTISSGYPSAAVTGYTPSSALAPPPVLPTF